MHRRLFVSTAAATLAALPALAQTQQQRARAAQEQGTTANGARTESVMAPAFVNAVAISDMFELQSSQLAERQSQNADIKRFAQHMQRDHTKTTTELKAMMARMPNFEVPTQLDGQHQQMLTQLQAVNGKEFDQLYLQQQVQAHQNAVDLFRNYSRSGDNADLKRWAASTLPTLEEHLRDVRRLHA